MKKYEDIVGLAKELLSAIGKNDQEQMAVKMDELEHDYKDVFSTLNNYEAIYAYFFVRYAAVEFFQRNNYYNSIYSTWEDVSSRYDGFSKSKLYSSQEKNEIQAIIMQIKAVKDGTKKSTNVPSPRHDCRCSLCRRLPANAVGSHMAPNFLAHPSLSYDQRGKRYREATDRFSINDIGNPMSFYGAEVPPERIQQTLEHEVTEEDIANNINVLEYDNYFCSQCEHRFSILETAYAEYYHNPVKSISPRVTYLFWLSVLWRMGVSRMGLYLDAADEFSIREILDKAILEDVKSIAQDTCDLRTWCYAIYRVDGIRQYDKGVFGSRQESSPYVLLLNDLIVVLFNKKPSLDTYTCGPLQIDTSKLNTWQKKENVLPADRRCFMDVRDWIVETSYQYYDPPREQALLLIREAERSDGRILSDQEKDMLIKTRRLVCGPVRKMVSLRKAFRIGIASAKKKMAEEAGETYEPLEDEDLFLTANDFQNYYTDMLNAAHQGIDVSQFPFYDQARNAFPNEKWKGKPTEEHDSNFCEALDWISEIEGPDGMAELYGLPPKSSPAVSHKIRPNDPCPCGSGLKYKRCHGRSRG